MTALLRMTEKVPIVVILGATGAGKSKLALELAQHFGGEIISADAMQMYKGLDIVTNKVTAEEQTLVKHHMIDFLDPVAKNNVVDFRNKALPIVENLLREGKIPFICGGTNYYIESLLWKILIDEDTTLLVNTDGAAKKRKSEQDDEGRESEKKHFKATETSSEENEVNWNSVNFSVEKDLEHVSTQILYDKLRTVDPERADSLHPKERRKICRTLQIYQKYGKCHSKLLEEQKVENGSSLGGGLRFPVDRICIIEVWSHPEILTERCNKRVDKMIEVGMVQELENFHEQYNKLRLNELNSTKEMEGSYTDGIFQSIGFKEFHPYLTLSETERNSPKGKAMFKKGVEYMKIVTRQYAKKQLKWMNKRFLLDERNPPAVYRVDSSAPSAWKEAVYKPAEDIVTAFIEGRTPDATPLQRNVTQGSIYEDFRKTFHCDICNRDFKGQRQYRNHLNGKEHKKVRRLNGLEKIIVTKYVLILENFEEENKTEVVKELKGQLEIGNMKIMDAMKNLPCEIGSAMGERKATKIVKMLKQFNVVLGIKQITKEIILGK